MGVAAFCRLFKGILMATTAKRHTRRSKGGSIAAGKTNPDLAEYKRKRDFTRTREPKPVAGRTAKAPIFVIQKHAATRLHWDFRLEADGVLKSWAVTKEPTLDPTVKRLAVRVEDHPFGYATFHGDIPAGEYGAGHVDIWDRGTFEPKFDVTDGMRRGKVEVTLHGKRLKGAFALVRMGPPSEKENWLLIKMKDEYAKAGTDTSEEKPAKTKSSKSDRRSYGLEAGVTGKVSQDGKSQKVQFTHVDKMWFPQAGATKGDVLRFYLEIAPILLPYLKSRPMTLERLPDGLTPNAPQFWQKNTPKHYPQWIARVNLPTEDGREVEYTLVNDENALAYLVNQGAITFHPYLSRIWDLEHPDFVLFDLDVGEASFADAVKIAKRLHALLDKQGVESFPKTSGKSGLHVLTPWTNDGGYEKARAWASEIADEAVRALPSIATTERSKSGRRGRVYVDVMQNAKGKHVVPPWVVRATPRATVSTPLQWDEVTGRLDPRKFTMKVALQRAKKGDAMQALVESYRRK
jgi:bifunctional non-homologous end joining protein LigD